MQWRGRKLHDPDLDNFREFFISQQIRQILILALFLPDGCGIICPFNINNAVYLAILIRHECKATHKETEFSRDAAKGGEEKRTVAVTVEEVASDMNPKFMLESSRK